MTTSSRSLALAGGAALLVGVLGAGIAIGSGAPGRSTLPSAAVGFGAAAAGAPAATVSSAADPNADVVDAALAAFDQSGTPGAPGLAPGTDAPSLAGLAQRIRRFARWNMLVHATVTVDRPGIGIQTYDLDHGTISGSSTSPLTIAEAGGTSVTVGTDGSTRVRKDGKKAALTDLASGDRVIVVSLAQGTGAPKALLVLVPAVAGTTATP